MDTENTKQNLVVQYNTMTIKMFLEYETSQGMPIYNDGDI